MASGFGEPSQRIPIKSLRIDESKLGDGVLMTGSYICWRFLAALGISQREGTSFDALERLNVHKKIKSNVDRAREHGTRGS